MTHGFLVDTYEQERFKTASVWSMFGDGDLAVRPRRDDPRGRSVREQMVHQCLSEDIWFRTMLGIDVGAPPCPPRRPGSASSAATSRIPAAARCSCGAATPPGGRGTRPSST